MAGMVAQESLCVRSTERIRNCLRQATSLATSGESLRVQLQRCADGTDAVDGSPVPFSLLRQAVSLLRDAKVAGDHTWVHRVVAGSGVVFNSPGSAPRNPELQKRLDAIQDTLDKKAYASMVKDVAKSGPFPGQDSISGEAQDPIEMTSFRHSLSFGTHVLVAMGTLYAFGHYVGRHLSSDPAIHALGGVLGLVAALLAEVLLFVIRSSPMKEY